MAKDSIIEIKGSDLISESMSKINHNFNTLSEVDEQNDLRWQRYTKQIEDKIDAIQNLFQLDGIEMRRAIESVDDKFDNLPNMDNIQGQIANAISNLDSEVGLAIRALAGQEFGAAMNDYAKTSAVNEKLEGYVVSTTFNDYKSNAQENQAESNIITANSKFYTVEYSGNEYFVYVNGERSEYKNLKEYYNSLTPFEKSQFDPNGAGLSDPNVLKGFMTLCESVFKTVSTELVGFSTKVAEDMAQLDIVTQVTNDEGKKISAAIIAQANSEGSEVKLNADHINISANHDLSINSGGNVNIKSGGGFNIESGGDLKIKSGGKFEITSSNFNIDSNGNVSINGAITATSLTIAPNSSAESTFNSLVLSAGGTTWAEKSEIPEKISDLSNDTGFITNSALSNYTTTSTLNNTLSTYAKKSEVPDEYDDTWLTSALSKVNMNSGLVLTGNVFVADASSYITAGIMGGNTSGNDLRIFAGSSNLSSRGSAPFRVYEDGSFYATNAHITGTIEATSLTIAPNSSATSQFNSLVQSAGSVAGYINTSTLTTALSNYTTSTALGYALSNYATKSDLSSVASYSDGWLTRAFGKTAISGGLVLTGNVFAADSSNNVTAGMMGGSTSGNDLRFFAGSADTASAPFRVYEDGTFYAEKANVSGVINRYFKITSSNWQEYATQIGERNGEPYYVIDLNKIKKNVEITYIPPVPSGVGLIFDVRTPSITADMVGMELNVLNFIPKKTISVGHNGVDYYTTGTPPTNAMVIRPANNDNGYVGGNTNSGVGTFQCMRLIAIELPNYSGSGSQYAWLRTDSYSVYTES